MGWASRFEDLAPLWFMLLEEVRDSCLASSAKDFPFVIVTQLAGSCYISLGGVGGHDLAVA